MKQNIPSAFNFELIRLSDMSCTKNICFSLDRTTSKSALKALRFKELIHNIKLYLCSE
jgi:hypothetical protein